mgnify:CR=1 FL=1
MKRSVFKKLKKSLNQAAKLILATSLLVSCAGIPGDRIKLKDYPETEQKVIDGLDLSYRITKKPDWIKKYNPQKYPDPYENQVDDSYILAERISGKLDSGFRSTKEYSSTFKRCDAVISTKVYWSMPMTCFFHQYLSAFTLTIIPYYCQTVYEAKVTLISTSDNRVLKEYYLKDKVHEVWSLLWFLATLPVDSWGRGPTPEGAKKIVEQNISEAISRQILNDASNFKECQKDQPLLPKKND